MHAEPQKEHRWLDQLVGEWTVESECIMGPDKPMMKTMGKETVRSLGGLWTVAEGEMDTPGGGVCKHIMTLGYDPQAQAYVGTWIGSVMTHAWSYRGSLNAAETILTLDTEGPNFTQSGMAPYQDIIEIVSEDHRILRSQVQGEDGHWFPFMTAHYRRKQ